MTAAIVIGALWLAAGLASLAYHLRVWGAGACPVWQWPFVVVLWPGVYLN